MLAHGAMRARLDLGFCSNTLFKALKSLRSRHDACFDYALTQSNTDWSASLPTKSTSQMNQQAIKNHNHGYVLCLQLVAPPPPKHLWEGEKGCMMRQHQCRAQSWFSPK